MRQYTPSPTPSSNPDTVRASRAGALSAYSLPPPKSRVPPNTYAGRNGALLAATHVGRNSGYGSSSRESSPGTQPSTQNTALPSTATRRPSSSLLAAQISAQRQRDSATAGSAKLSDISLNTTSLRPQPQSRRSSVLSAKSSVDSTDHQANRLSLSPPRSRPGHNPPGHASKQLQLQIKAPVLDRAQSDSVAESHDRAASPTISRLLQVFEQNDSSILSLGRQTPQRPSTALSQRPNLARSRSSYETALIAAQSSVRASSRPQSRADRRLFHVSNRDPSPHFRRLATSQSDSFPLQSAISAPTRKRRSSLSSSSSVPPVAMSQNESGAIVGDEALRPPPPLERSRKSSVGSKSQPVPSSAPQSPTRLAVSDANRDLQLAATRLVKPHMTGDSFANAIVASSLASSRAPSPTKTSVPPPPPKRRTKGHHLFAPSHSHQSTPSRTPSPSKGLRQTLRKPTKSDDEDEDDNRWRPKNRLARKHPNKHHEGDRKRWKDAVTERQRKRYEGVWAANREEPESGLTSTPTTERYVLNIVVRHIWIRSRLQREILEEIWNLVEDKGVDRLNREQFVVGMWLIDQKLKGRKLPLRVSQSVWDSVRGFGNVRLAPKIP